MNNWHWWDAQTVSPVSPDALLPFTPFRGAFCIPGALPGIPYGDGARIWTPAFGCYANNGGSGPAPVDWQDKIIEETKRRGYTWLAYQISGRPYGNDYPELALDPDRTVRDLRKLHHAGLHTIVAFRDDVGTDCAYLQAVADVTQGLVDATMGIYESNGVFDWDEAKVLSVLAQQHQLWPNAICAFHSTSQDNGGRGFGEADFWRKAAAVGVNCYFLQQSCWPRRMVDGERETQANAEREAADRAEDFVSRLQYGLHGWPILPHGVVLFEETTSRTYRDWNESAGVNVMDELFRLIPHRPAGFMDSGSIVP